MMKPISLIPFDLEDFRAIACLAYLAVVKKKSLSFIKRMLNCVVSRNHESWFLKLWFERFTACPTDTDPSASRVCEM